MKLSLPLIKTQHFEQNTIVSSLNELTETATKAEALKRYRNQKMADLLIYRLSNKYYLLNPFEDGELNKDAQLFQITREKYDELTNGENAPLHPGQDNDWLTAAFSIGLIGDGLWEATNNIAANHPDVSLGLNFALPLALGPIVGLANYYGQLRTFKQQFGREPNSAEKKQMKRNSAALAFRMTAAVVGWEAGYWIARSVLFSLNVIPYALLANLAMAFAVGLGQGIGIVTATLITEKKQHGKIQSSWRDVAKLFLAGFATGALWYALKMIPFVSICTPKLAGAARKAFIVAFSAISRAIIVTGIYALTKPKTSVHFVKRVFGSITFFGLFSNKKLQSPASSQSHGVVEPSPPAATGSN